MPFEADDRIANYRIERPLGSTSSGALYEATHVVLPRRAVIKVVHASAIGMQAFAVQLLREACLLEALRHPGIPALFEAGRLRDGRPWFAAEVIAGITLVERMVAGPLPALEVAGLVRDVAAILEHAHRRGIVHRNVRPDQIVLAAGRGFPVAIPDWNDAQAHDAVARIPRMPSPGARNYVAPELARGDATDDRADIYALGATAYHVLTGALPRDASTGARPALVTAHTAPVPTLERRPDTPPELATLVDQMLAYDRFDRPSSAEVRADLDWLATVLPPEVEDVQLVDTEGVAAPQIRIRRPRWTPPYTDIATTLAPVSGEIDLAKRR